MSKIGTLASGAAKTFDLSYLPQFLQFGSVDLDFSVSSLSIIARGKNIVQLSDSAQIQALFQFETGVIAAGTSTDLARKLWIGEGRIEGQSTITATNVNLTTPDVYANSLGKALGGLARSIAVTPVIASGNNTFQNFDLIYFLPANVDRAQVVYKNGFTEDLSAEELSGLYASNNSLETSGLINGFVPVQGNRAVNGFGIASVTLFATSGGNIDVVVCGWQKL